MQCAECGDEADELVPFKIGGKRVKICEECHEIKEEEAAIAEEAESVMQSMMEYKGR